ncbi:LysR family transcriptional regulator [Pseudonocardia sp. TRM90224]|uniref:LysR family transcriptional regulator n=1 Tax=Pseudonocardia sp. TRM90224 TaxID=2812678 RepID=UPI001E30D378|nr:LysR family transcriptional regulator [Pseudonocardia sp. TRM90224]
MDVREVEVFLVLADELHFGRTAERLRVTQGRVSQLIKELEREIGGALFERSSRAVRLTALGQHFRTGAVRILDEVETTLRTSKDLARRAGRRLRVGYTPCIGLDLVARLASAYTSSRPADTVTFASVGMRTAEPFDSLVLDDSTDVALMWCPTGYPRTPGRVVGPALATDRRAVLVPADHPLSGRTALVLDDLCNHPLLDPGLRSAPALRELWAPHLSSTRRPLTYTGEDLATMIGRPDVGIGDVYPLVLAGHGLHLTVLSVLDRVPCPGLVAVPVVDMVPAAVVPVWRAAAGSDALRTFVELAVSLGTAAPLDVPAGSDVRRLRRCAAPRR